MTDSVQLLRQFVATGSESAFAAVVQQHISFVYAAARRQLGFAPHRAEDIAQTVFIQLARHAPTVVERDNLLGWLHRTTHYAAAKAKRAEARRSAREREAQSRQEPAAGPPPDAALRVLLDEALLQLDESDRGAVLMRFFENARFADIGRQLRTSEDAARMRVDRALGKLHGVLARRGITSTTAALAAALADEALIAAPAGMAGQVTNQALAAGVGGATSLFKSLSGGNLLAGVAAVVSLLALGLAQHRLRVAREMSAAVVTATREVEAMETRRNALAERVSAEEQEAAALDARVAQLRTTLEQERARANEAAQRAKIAGAAFLGRHSVIRDLSVAYGRAKIPFQYGPFFRSLQLTSAQAEELAALMPNGTVFSLRDTPEPLTIEIPNPMPSKQRQERIRSILGAEGYDQLQHYQNTAVPARTLAFSETPLSPAQAEAFASVGAASVKEANYGSNSSFDWEQLMARSASVLSPAQLKVLGRLHRATQANLWP